MQRLRESRRLNLMQAAQKAGLHRATLDRWEKGGSQPRLKELHALLTALNADTQQQQKALELIEAPRAVRLVRSTLAQTARQSGLPPMPNGGDLLSALRIRQRLSLEEAARRVEVTSGTLRRWEKMELWPSQEQLQRLCYALGAHEAEIVALTLGQFSQMLRMEKSSIETVRERLEELKDLLDDHPNGYALFELTYLQLEADAWPLALRSAAGKQMLTEVYAYHAQTLSVNDRLPQAGRVANQAMEMMEEMAKPERFWLYPVIVSARAYVFGGEKQTPKRGLERLRSWSALKQWPAMQAWMLADMAKYLSLSGEVEAALTLAEQSCEIVERTGEEYEWILRRRDKALLLLQAGRPAEALPLIEVRAIGESLLGDRIDVFLLRAEAYLGVGNRSEAHDWLQRAQTDVEASNFEVKRPQVARLVARF